MAMEPIYFPNSKVKTLTTEVNTMFVGKSIYIFGKVDKNASIFCIDLINGMSPPTDTGGNDTPLHLAARFPMKVVNRCIFKDNKWLHGETSTTFPFAGGEKFMVKITCMKDHFRIGVNNNPCFATYQYRLPCFRITNVHVSGDCNIILITSQIHGLEVPALGPLSAEDVNRYDIPFYDLIGRKIRIVGIPTRNDGAFEMNLSDRDEKVLFRYSPNMTDQIIDYCVKTEKDWKEPLCQLGLKPLQKNKTNERPPFYNVGNPENIFRERKREFVFPYHEEEPFQTTIHVEKDGFQVKINGMSAFIYNDGSVVKRIEQIRKLRVQGNVSIREITYF